jgi:hypothetical protein
MVCHYGLAVIPAQVCKPKDEAKVGASVLLVERWILAAERNDLLEVLEYRYDRSSTLVSSQFPISSWHETIGKPTLADAILNRLVHQAHKITLKGESMRKTRFPLTQTDQSVV